MKVLLNLVMLNDKRVYISYSQNHLFDFWGVNERWKT